MNKTFDKRSIILPAANIVIVFATILLCIATFSDRIFMRRCFAHGGYYVTLLLILFWIITIIRCISEIKPDWRLFLKKNLPGLVFSLFMTVLVFVSVTPRFRLLNDETNFVSISKTLTYEKRTDVVTMGKWYYDKFHPVKRIVPRRYILFPFFTHLLHTVLGFRAENVFLLNSVILFTLLFIIYVSVNGHFGRGWAVSAVLLVASQPLVVQTAASGAHDLMATLFMVIVFLCLKYFLQTPSSLRFQLLWVNLLILANIRYEGTIFFFLALLCLLVLRYLKKEYFRGWQSVIYYSSPLILLLLVWQLTLTGKSFIRQGVRYSLEHLVKNNAIILKSLFDYKFYLPAASIINFIGILGLIYLGYLFLSKRIVVDRPRRHLVSVSFACIAANWLIITSYYQGSLTMPAVSRYYLTFFMICSLLTMLFFKHLKTFGERPVWMLVFSVFVFFIYHPVSVEDRFSKTIILSREQKFVTGFLRKIEETRNRNFLVISEKPQLYTVYDYGSVSFKYANKNKLIPKEFRKQLYETIFVIQDIDYKTGKPTTKTTLRKDFKLKTLVELQNRSRNFIRISKVASIK